MFHDAAAPLAERKITLAEMMTEAKRAGNGASLFRHLFAETSLARDEAEALFDLERAGLSQSAEWRRFFVEAVTDHVVWDRRPTGRLDEEGARWLLGQVDRARTPASFALLIHVMDEAESLPDWFAAEVRVRAAAGWPGVMQGEDLFPTPVAGEA